MFSFLHPQVTEVRSQAKGLLWPFGIRFLYRGKVGICFMERMINLWGKVTFCRERNKTFCHCCLFSFPNRTLSPHFSIIHEGWLHCQYLSLSPRAEHLLFWFWEDLATCYALGLLLSNFNRAGNNAVHSTWGPHMTISGEIHLRAKVPSIDSVSFSTLCFKQIENIYIWYIIILYIMKKKKN